jgi:NADH-quinone oxidoreductase subunit L
MLVGTLALCGFPLTAGFYSKDAIIEAVSAAQGHVALASLCLMLLIVSAFFTAFYSWRLMFMTFHGAPRANPEVMSHAHESPPIMLVPLYLLAAGALFAGILFAGSFIGEEEGLFWGTSLYRSADNNVLADMHHAGVLVGVAPLFMLVAGFALAWLFYIRDPAIPVRLAERHEPLYRFLLNKWYFDEIYDALIVRPTLWLGRALWKYGDGRLIDGLGPDGVSARVIDVTQQVIRLQTGYLYHYAFAMLIGVAALVTYYSFAGVR